ncbi:unnamed protein product [Rotaria sp. Silwood1]|nr:unnamed protein product [Rotaria sp. Silwood1]
MNIVLSDLKIWLEQRQNPCVIHTIAFLMGHTSDDPKPRKFMAKIAAMTGGVFRCMDPCTPLHQEFGDDSYSDDSDFNDDEFLDFFQERLRDVPTQLLENAGLPTKQQNTSSPTASTNTSC